MMMEMKMKMVREGIREVQGIPNPTNGEDDVMIY